MWFVVSALATSKAKSQFLCSFAFSIPALTASTTSPTWEATLQFNNLTLGPTDQLYISETVTNDVTVISYGALL